MSVLANSNPAYLLEQILDATREYLKSNAPVIDAFTGGVLETELSLKLPIAKRVSAVALLKSVPIRADDITQSVVKKIIAAKDVLEWQQSYTEADGFDADYLSRYGWFNLISPEGPYVCDSLRISVGYWGEGLYYTEHWHEPEEYYLVLAGEATFLSEGHPPNKCAPGDIIHHQSNQPHAIDMTPGPLLAMAIWRGGDLVAKSGLPEGRVTHE